MKISASSHEPDRRTEQLALGSLRRSRRAAGHRRAGRAAPPGPAGRSAWSLRCPGRRGRDPSSDSRFRALKSSPAARPIAGLRGEMPSTRFQGFSVAVRFGALSRFCVSSCSRARGSSSWARGSSAGCSPARCSIRPWTTRAAGLTQYVDGVLRPLLVRGNGLHISPHLPVQLEAQFRRQPGPDHGQGVAPRRHARLDEPLARSESASVSRSTGTSARRSRPSAPVRAISKLGSEENAVEKSLGLTMSSRSTHRS